MCMYYYILHLIRKSIEATFISFNRIFRPTFMYSISLKNDLLRWKKKKRISLCQKKKSQFVFPEKICLSKKIFFSIKCILHYILLAKMVTLANLENQVIFIFFFNKFKIFKKKKTNIYIYIYIFFFNEIHWSN